MWPQTQTSLVHINSINSNPPPSRHPEDPTTITLHPRLRKHKAGSEVAMAAAFILPVAQIPHPRTKRLADATKYTVSTAVAVALVCNRDAGTVLYAVGGLMSSLSAGLLKRVIGQPRPTDMKRDPGMPSSHATSLAFLSLAAWGWGALGGLGSAAVAAAVLGSCARVRVGYHSRSQVAAGWLLGGVNAAVWLTSHRWFVPSLQTLMDGFGDVAVMVVLAVAAAAIALPDILEVLRKH